MTQCVGSECGARPTVQPGIRVFPPARLGNGSIETLFLVGLCPSCQANARLEDFDSESFRENVGKVMDAMGLAKADWSRNRLFFRLLGRE